MLHRAECLRGSAGVPAGVAGTLRNPARARTHGNYGLHIHCIAPDREPSPQSSSSKRAISEAAAVGWEGPASTSLQKRATEAKQLPDVDWTRYHQQIMFVDRSDTVRARVAVGLFERVSEWNGYGRVMIAFASGLAADGTADAATTASLMAQAMRLGIRPKLFAAPRDQLVREDLDRFDLVVALDRQLQGELLQQLLDPQDRYDREWAAYYRNKVCTLTDFSDYNSAQALAATGGSALLNSELRSLLPPALRSALPPAGEDSPGASGAWNYGDGGGGRGRTREVAGASGAGGVEVPALTCIERPELTSAGMEGWSTMVGDVLLCCAGLFRYLADQYPPDLPDWEDLGRPPPHF